MPSTAKKVVCLMGPTASGKTGLALELIQRLPLEIVSVDSALVYRGMDVGTAKPSKEELMKAPHRLIDICDPDQAYSAGQFRTDALREITDIFNQNKTPLLVGGTMLYFNVLQNGVAELPTASPEIREQILHQAQQSSWAVMHQQLEKVDPKAAAKIHPNDAQRIQRALEVFQMTGQPLSELQQQAQASALPYEVINLMIVPPDRAVLHEKIAQRFDLMLEQGFIDEVKQLRERYDLNADLPSMRTVGYRQAWQYLEGDIDFATMRDKAIAATRQLAKRQYTWLKRDWRNAFVVESLEEALRVIQV